MCARYAIYASMSSLASRFNLQNSIQLAPSYNRAPSALLPIIAHQRIGLARWGLVPGWARPESRPKGQHNARVETAAGKPWFRSAWKQRRCLVPASGYFEWKTLEDGSKQPFYFHFDEQPFAFAGLWEKTMEGDLTFTILTQPASAAVQNTHHRMPVILPADAYDDWLQGGVNILPASRRYMQGMQRRTVAAAVNNARNDRPELLLPL